MAKKEPQCICTAATNLTEFPEKQGRIYTLKKSMFSSNTPLSAETTNSPE